MKKSVMKITVPCLCAALVLTGMGGAYSALASGSESAAPLPAVSRAAAAADAAAPVKDETVYVLAGSDGGVEKVIVSDWLKNTAGSAALAGPAGLAGLENVKGNESAALQDGAVVWDAQGRDIYCQGVSDGALPVEMRISYTLDGKTVTAGELAGKSGHVVIRFDYVNRQYREVELDGRMERIYVPFAMLTGMVLDNDVFTNVEISSGRIYSDGSRTVAAGIAFPGLQDSLDLDSGKLEIPDSVEVSADVTDFRLAETFTIADGSFFSDLDTGKLDDAGDLSGSLRELADAMDQLMDGSDQLRDGLSELLERSGQLAGGIDQLAEGADGLCQGTDELKEGAGALHTGAEELEEGAGTLGLGVQQLDEGAKALDQGLETLAAQNDTLNGGAQKVFETLLASAESQLRAAGGEVPALTAENYAQVLDGVSASLKGTPAGKQVAGLKASLDSYSAFCQGLAGYTAGVAQAAEGAAGLADGTARLQAGADELRAGAGQLSAGAGALREGAVQLADGAAQLRGGLVQLQSGVPALIGGVTQLRDGAGELSGGLREFDEKGIQKLVDAVDGDLAGLTDRIRAVADAAGSYTSFSGNGGAEDQVKFVYRTQAIKEN